jgi:hypothetical protein
MDRSKKLVVVGGVLAALAIGAGAVWAGSSDDKPLRGNSYERATEAALDHVGGGTVVETEVGDDGAAYGVEIRTDDGSVVEVNLDENFEVIGQEADDDGPNDTEEAGDD